MQTAKPHLGSSFAGNVIPAQQIQFARPRDKESMAPIVAPKPIEPEPAPVHLHQPQVTLIKEGDTVYGIEVQCTCGEVIRLDCKYVE